MRHHQQALRLILCLAIAIALSATGEAQTNATTAFSAFANASGPDAATQKAENDALTDYYQGWDDSWQRNLPAALAAAKKSGKPILVLISAPWSIDSQAFERDITADGQAFGKLKEEYILLRYVLSRDDPPLPEKLIGEYFTIKRDAPGDAHAMSNAPSTKLLPCAILLDSRGTYLGEVVGYKGGGYTLFESSLQEMEAKSTFPRQ